MGNYNKIFTKSTFKYAFMVALGTFFLALLFTLISQSVIEEINSLFLSFLLLLFIIVLGVFFDILGIAVAAANATPFHSRASRKLFGAREALWMIKNADKVSNFCSDIIGDICGTLSGAIGLSIVFLLHQSMNEVELILLTTLMTAMVAALTVGGKALGKKFAIVESYYIILSISVFLHIFKRKSQNR